MTHLNPNQETRTFIKLELLRALRAGMSTQELSRRLGYRFDKVKRWEANQKHLRWDEFCDLCQVLHVPLVQALRETALLDLDVDDEDVTHFVVRHFRKRYPGFTIEQLAEKLNCAVSVFKRFLRAEVYPDLEFVFALMGINDFWLGTFVLRLLPPDASPRLAEHFAAEQVFLNGRAEARSPFAIAVETALVFPEYLAKPLHDPRFLADKVGCTENEVGQILLQSLTNGTVTRSANGKYAPNFTVENPSGSHRASFIRSFHFWLQRSIVRLNGGEPINRRPDLRGLAGFTVCAASSDAIAKINEVLRRANDEIANIHAQDEGPYTEVRVSLWQSFNSNDIPDRLFKQVQEGRPILNPDGSLS